ncbi:MAG: hypothetical protein QM758_28385 [Armatimonas sp.]
MNPVTYSLTPEDWAEHRVWLYETQPDKETPRRRQLAFSLLMLLPMYLFLTAILGFSVPLFVTLALAIFGTVAINRFLYSPAQIKKQIYERTRLESTPGDTRTVSLTPRGVLEVDDCEERLTLYDAITETALTDTFLHCKDRKGGILLIPMRAFASSAAAVAFHMELENRRMRYAVGLTPAISTPVALVETPQVISVTPQAQAAQPWWRSSAKVDNESVANRKK